MKRAAALQKVASRADMLAKLLKSDAERDAGFLGQLDLYLRQMVRAWPHADPIRRQGFAPVLEQAQLHRHQVLNSLSRLPANTMTLFLPEGGVPC